MSDHYTYSPRTYHCPVGCGHNITERSRSATPYAMCPRCNGADFKSFRFDPDHSMESEHPKVAEVKMATNGMNKVVIVEGDG